MLAKAQGVGIHDALVIARQPAWQDGVRPPGDIGDVVEGEHVGERRKLESEVGKAVKPHARFEALGPGVEADALARETTEKGSHFGGKIHGVYPGLKAGSGSPASSSVVKHV